MSIGLIHVYTGDGKGKTTCALGQAVRAMGYGMRVYIAQFLKSKDLTSGEVRWLSQFQDSIRIVRYNQVHPMFDPGVDVSQLCASISNALNEAQKAMVSGDYDIIILDEINNAIADKFVEIRTVVEFIKSKPDQVELILTGRNAAKEVINLADYVTEMRCVKHPFKAGTPARRGIEF